MSKESNQNRTSQSGGGQVVGKAPGGVLRQVVAVYTVAHATDVDSGVARSGDVEAMNRSVAPDPDSVGTAAADRKILEPAVHR